MTDSPTSNGGGVTVYGPCPNCSIGMVNSNAEGEADASCGVCSARWKGGIGDWTALPPKDGGQR